MSDATHYSSIQNEQIKDQHQEEHRKSSSDRNSGRKSDTENFETENVTLIEDVFGQYYDYNGVQHCIKRYTWKNKNNIQVQVINYGARITSIKFPDRKGAIEDIVLGFDDLAGYIYYTNHYFGSVIGRMSNVVRNSTCVVDKQECNLTKNKGEHHYNGGNNGLHRQVWDTFVSGKKVIMSHLSPDLTEGYPGDLLIRVMFELTAKNEFKVEMDAQTTKPTLIGLSQLVYFNLAGHHRGAEESYNHIITLNCNCFTPYNNNGMPTGEILNVIHTPYDFQIPKLLGKVIGITPKDGYDQNLCVNRGTSQGDCFIGRILHPPSGRMLELYSNQPGVNFSTANTFGYGRVLSMQELLPKLIEPAKMSSVQSLEMLEDLFNKVHERLEELLKIDVEDEYKSVRDLIEKIKNFTSENLSLELTQFQYDYLIKASEIVCDAEDEDCQKLKEILQNIIIYAKVKKSDDVSASKRSSNLSTSGSQVTEKSLSRNSSTSKETGKPVPQKKTNFIPCYYKKANQILGKERAVYKTHGGIAIQCQNYPNCANVKNFPPCILRPGEIYRHTMTYRFWIRAGNPNRWIKRNMNDSPQTPPRVWKI